jgi:hypothetical protein
MRASRCQDSLLRANAVLNNDEQDGPDLIVFDYDSFAREVVSGNQLLALDEFHSFHSAHPFDYELGQQSLSLLMDIVIASFPLPPGVCQKTILILSLLSQEREVAEIIVGHPFILSTLLPFAILEETVMLLAQLSQFPNPRRIMLQCIPIRRLLEIARFSQNHVDVQYQLMRIVFFCSRQHDLDEHTISEIFSFAHFCVTKGNLAWAYYPITSIANLVKEYNVIDLVEEFGFVPLCNALILRVEKAIVIATLQFFAFLSQQTCRHLDVLNYERLAILLRAQAYDVQLAVLDVWYTLISVLSQGESGRLCQLIERLNLQERLCAIVDGGYFQAKSAALHCLSALVKVFPVESVVTYSPEFVESVCGVLMAEEKEAGVIVSGLQVLVAILRTAEKVGSNIEVAEWVAGILDQDTLGRLLESTDPVVRQNAMDLDLLLPGQQIPKQV